MRGAVYLAWRYLLAHRVKTAILVTALTLIFFIPAGLQVLVSQSQAEMTSRALATPLLVGAKGSPLELVLSSLYFTGETPERIPWSEVDRIGDSGLARPIPLYVRFHAEGAPVVGTTLDYFGFRGLRVVRGRSFIHLGECLVGARVAAAHGVEPGSKIVTSPETVFDIAGVYPLRMHVAGILTPNGTADDDAIFVDVKTAWVIEGIGHGHEDLAAPSSAPQVLKKEGDVVIGNSSVVQYNEVTPENESSFHYHGDPAAFPLTAVLALPKDVKSGTILRGRYGEPQEREQILAPRDVIDDLLGTVVTIQSYVVAAFVLVGATVLAVAALVFLLSLRLRSREIETLVKLGGGRAQVATVVWAEIVSVLLASVVLAALLTLATSAFGSAAVRAVIR